MMHIRRRIGLTLCNKPMGDTTAAYSLSYYRWRKNNKKSESCPECNAALSDLVLSVYRMLYNGEI